MANKHMKRSTSLFIRETHIKTIMKYCYLLIRVAEIKSVTIISVDLDEEKLKLSYTTF